MQSYKIKLVIARNTTICYQLFKNASDQIW